MHAAAATVAVRAAATESTRAARPCRCT
jgi:hypothetical protein